MRITAVVNRYLTTDIRPNSLTVVDRYPFGDVSSARDFVSMIKKVDRRVVQTKLTFSDL